MKVPQLMGIESLCPCLSLVPARYMFSSDAFSAVPHNVLTAVLRALGKSISLTTLSGQQRYPDQSNSRNSTLGLNDRHPILLPVLVASAPPLRFREHKHPSRDIHAEVKSPKYVLNEKFTSLQRRIRARTLAPRYSRLRQGDAVHVHLSGDCLSCNRKRIRLRKFASQPSRLREVDFALRLSQRGLVLLQLSLI